MSPIEASAQGAASPGALSTRAALEDTTVAVLMGGASRERAVSLVTGREVLRALSGAQVKGRLRRALGVEIGADGRWLVDPAREPLPICAALDALTNVDVFFNGLHGGDGENGTLQGLLALAKRRSTGSGVRASAICMDKQATRMLASGAGLRIAPGCVVSARDFDASQARELQRARSLADDGWVIKPRCGGSSVDTFVIADAGELAPAIERVLATGDDALIEARVRGVEVSCGVLENRGETGRALPPVEIQPTGEHFFDYEQKYNEHGAREVCPPENVSSDSVRRVQECALAIHRAAGCDGYSRSDFIVPAAGEPVLLEINTLPGLTPRSLLPQEAAAAGIDYESLCLMILELALRAQGCAR